MSIDTIEKAIKSILTSDIAVNALIEGRCYPLTLPQNPEYPLCLYIHISGTRENQLRGDAGQAHKRYQIESWAKTYAEAKELSNAVANVLNQYSGTVGTVVIGSILIENENETYEEVVKVNRVMQDYMIWHQI
jgi:hypothetical protein